ncbi:MAG: hypothetical protein IT454_20680 [Planctomycetes bacterium]|nr:hypothetical protein [Planctomycetota bacterium]
MPLPVVRSLVQHSLRAVARRRLGACSGVARSAPALSALSALTNLSTRTTRTAASAPTAAPAAPTAIAPAALLELRASRGACGCRGVRGRTSVPRVTAIGIVVASGELVGWTRVESEIPLPGMSGLRRARALLVLRDSASARGRIQLCPSVAATVLVAAALIRSPTLLRAAQLPTIRLPAVVLLIVTAAPTSAATATAAVFRSAPIAPLALRLARTGGIPRSGRLARRALIASAVARSGLGRSNSRGG